MKAWPGRWVVSFFLLSSVRLAFAGDIAPGLADDAIAGDASEALTTLTASLDPDDQRVLPGIYVAVDPSRTDVLALPACDDDGDYVVVVSHAMFELVEDVAYATASDKFRGTHLVETYGDLLARAQATGARPLPPPAPLEATPGATPLDGATQTFERSLLAWIVAGELAHMLDGDVVCPHPTATHERADDEWTAGEHREALARAAERLAHVETCDAWATSRLLESEQPDDAVVAFFSVLAPLEEARHAGESWSYLTHHPGARARGARFGQAARARRAAQRAASETSAARTRMR